MCRLYGFLANELTKVDCSLVHAQNALLHQSIRDARGVSNADGWGISYYANGLPEVERRETAANADAHFSVSAERVYARAVVAHVRAATVGSVGMHNTHPFSYRRWTFAHNGTLHGFEAIRDRMKSELDDDLLDLQQGTTDSETAFYWVLSRALHSGIRLDDDDQPMERLIGLVRTAVKDLDALCAEAQSQRPARLNFLLTNGRVLLATCFRNSLNVVERRGVHDCEICGIPHIQHSQETEYRAVVVASEPITHEAWVPVPDGSIIAVDRDLATTVQPI